MDYSIKKVTIDDYDAIYELWNATEQSRRALNPVDEKNNLGICDEVWHATIREDRK